MRVRRSAAAALAVAAAAFAAPAMAAAASTISVAVGPSGGNVDLSTSLRIDTDQSGTPAAQATTIAEALSVEFANQLASFGTCDPKAFDNVQGPTPANCPDRSSVVGTATLTAKAPLTEAWTSDRAFVVHTGANKLVLWWHVTRPGAQPELAGQVPGTVTQEAGPYGPVATFDFSGLPQGARVARLDLAFPRGANGLAPFAASACPAQGTWSFQARIAYADNQPGETLSTTTPCGAAVVAPEPSKLQLARATITASPSAIDILAPITARASGNVDFELYAAGQRHRWSSPIDSQNARVRVNQPIPEGQGRYGTGILTMRYAGDADTRPQVVRLRAANGRALLEANRPTLDNGRLKASGTISPRARGVVRVQLEYFSGGQTTTIERFAQISGGRWTLDEALTPEQQTAIAQRAGTVQSYILFTGYLPRRMRGEMLSYQVLGAP